MNQLNTSFLSLVDQLAQTLWHNKEFSVTGDLLTLFLKYTEGELLNKMLANARMCYFQANRVQDALVCLDRQINENLDNSWEIYRDKANYLRYMDRLEESESCVEKIQDTCTRLLAESWFLHKKGQFKKAFQITELGRNGVFWWQDIEPLKLPLWNKQYNKNIVIFGESGNGDEIIFSRYINEIKPYCENLYYYTNRSLMAVFERNFGVKKYNRAITDCVMIPSMSLPFLLEKESPSSEPYITSNILLADKYKKTGHRIGLCFHGEPTHFETNLRTLPHKQLIDSVKDLAELVNLQKDYTELYENLNYLPFSSWEDTFALLDSCDLVITCDTSIAHAAAALGKPVLVLMHAAAYYTWNHNEPIGKSSWYKNAYCIKQTEPCKWDGSIQLARNLAKNILEGKTYDA